MASESAEQLVGAMESEAAIAAEAAELRGPRAILTHDLFLKLWPLLRRPIPPGFITALGKLEGKPYASTGVSAVQVQITRMDNVLTPVWWWDEVEYHQEGKLAHVRVSVGKRSEGALYSREAWGGVNRGSTTGNLYKGSYTNAAKVAFARVGPGHEVYMGATDFDPDTDEEAAKAQSATPARGGRSSSAERLLSDPERKKVVDAMDSAGKNIAVVLGSLGIESTDDLTNAHAFDIRAWLDGKKEL